MPENSQRARVLLLAYACSPFRGGEPGVGWHRAVETAKYFDTWVLCKQESYQDDIHRYTAIHGEIPGLHFRFVPLSRLQKLLRKTPLFYYLAYNLWHRRAYREAVKLHQQHHFDLAHQVNFNGFREPGYLWKLNMPFVWGPVGGTQNYPWRFFRLAGWRGALLESCRSVLNRLQFRFGRRVRQAAKRAAVVLTANSTGERDFARVHKIKPVRLLETGTTTVRHRPKEFNVRKNATLNILWCGVLGNRKALQLLLLALSQVPASVPYSLRILGRGPLLKRWQRLAQRLGLAPHCTWGGWVTHDQIHEHYDWADVFVFTSLRDTSGNVLLESLSRGLPVICLDHQGAGDIVTPECGLKIPVTTPKGVISELRDTITAVSEGKVDLEALSVGALAVAKRHHWSVNAAKVAGLYYDLIDKDFPGDAEAADPTIPWSHCFEGQRRGAEAAVKPHLVRIK